MQKITLAALALALAAAPALARNDAGMPRSPALPQADFAEIDRDGDGRITLEEWTAYMLERREARRAQRIEARVEAIFQAGDADDDGVLTREELAAGLTALQERRMAEWSGRSREQGARRGGWQRREGHGGGEGRMHRMGRPASVEEWAERSFTRIDTDGDGAISPEELAAAQERWQERAERRAERGAGQRGERQPRRAD